MENTIKLNKGMAILYIVIALTALLCGLRMNNLTSIGNNSTNTCWQK